MRAAPAAAVCSPSRRGATSAARRAMPSRQLLVEVWRGRGVSSTSSGRGATTEEPASPCAGPGRAVLELEQMLHDHAPVGARPTLDVGESFHLLIRLARSRASKRLAREAPPGSGPRRRNLVVRSLRQLVRSPCPAHASVTTAPQGSQSPVIWSGDGGQVVGSAWRPRARRGGAAQASALRRARR